jgi:hypothetical protein
VAAGPFRMTGKESALSRKRIENLTMVIVNNVRQNIIQVALTAFALHLALASLRCTAYSLFTI